MKLFEILFSPTGGTNKVCEIISNEFQGEREQINLMNKDLFKDKIEIMSDDICLIAVPSYGGRVPVPAIENLKKINGNQAKVILVVVFGNRAYDDTLLELKDIAEEIGFVCIAAIAAIAEHSIIHQFGSERPDEQDKEELKKYANEIFQTVSTRQTFEPFSVPGNRPYREYTGLPFHPKAGKECNECGTCASICPVGAIKEENPSQTDNDKCITCMGCVSVCPKQARKVSSILLGVVSNKIKKACSSRKENEFYSESKQQG